LALLCSYSLAQDDAVVVVSSSEEVAAADVEAVVHSEATEVGEIVEEGCGCTKPVSAQAAFEAVLNSFAQNLQADVSGYFAPGAFIPCLAETHLESVSFGTPVYSINLPNALAGKLAWEYQFTGSDQRFDDGALVFSIQTDAEQKITSLLIAHENEKFDERVPKPKPTTVGSLLNEFFGGLSSFNLRESLEHTTEDFALRILGDISLIPHHLNTAVSRSNFAEFKEEASQVFDFTGKSIRCLLQSEDDDSSASHCQVVGKHARVKFCLDALVFAEAKDGLLSSIDFYIAGACDPKTKFEDDEERAEKLRREAEKLEAKRKEEERKAEKAKEEAEKKALKSKKKEGEKPKEE